MLFNSPEFLLFLPIVFGLYWFVTQRSLKAQNLLLLVASYVFYGWWDWRFLGLIALSTIVDFFVGIRIEEATDRVRKKRWLWASLAINLAPNPAIQGMGAHRRAGIAHPRGEYRAAVDRCTSYSISYLRKSMSEPHSWRT